MVCLPITSSSAVSEAICNTYSAAAWTTGIARGYVVGELVRQ